MSGTASEVDGDLAAQVAWDDRGLAPAVVCHADTGAVLMLGWMNAASLAATRSTGLVTFFSRSRQAIWQKGESSGNTLAVDAIRLDCDADALLVTARPAGPTCHTGAASCFFRRADGGEDHAAWVEDGGPTGAPAAVLERLYATLAARRGASPEKSYTAKLLAGGPTAIIAKIREEAGELCDELRGESSDPARVASEAADLVYHVLVGLLSSGVEPSAVWRALEKRTGQGGLAEKASRR